MQGARTCYYSEVARVDGSLQEAGQYVSTDHMPASSLFALENIIQQRVEQQQQNTGESQLSACHSCLEITTLDIVLQHLPGSC